MKKYYTLLLILLTSITLAQEAPESPGKQPAENVAEDVTKEAESEESQEPEEPWHDVIDADVMTDADRIPATRTGGDCLITGATILTVSDEGTIENGSILIRDGKITAIGKKLNAPEDITVIDATGLFIMPGIIDCHSHIAMEAVNEASLSIVPEVGIKDVLDPNDLQIFRASAGGCTAANLLHGSANPIGGQNAVIKMKYKVTPEEFLFPGAKQGVKFALGENVKQSNWDNPDPRFPRTRMGVEATFRRAFTAAIEYKKEWAEYKAAKQAGEDPLPPRKDYRLEALAGILDGEILVHCHSYRADEILMMMRVAEEFGFRIQTFQHVLEGYKVAPEMAKHGAGGSTFADWWAYKFEVYDAIPHNAALMTRAGVVTSINSDSGDYIRRLNQEAAKTIKYGGLSEYEALRLVTLNPAIQLAIDEFVGTIETGKHADLAIYNGHPLSPYSRCVMTLVDGEVVFEDRDVPDHSTSDFDPDENAEFTLPDPPKKAGTYAIRNARIVPVTGEVIEKGAILMRDGKIADIGEKVNIPRGTEIIDGKGLSVYPGMIDAGSVLGLTEIGSVRGSRDDREIGDIHPDLIAATAVNSDSHIIPTVRADGITTVITRLTSGRIAGQVSLIQLDGWTREEMTLDPKVALFVNFPSPPIKKKDENKARKELKKWFEDAKEYGRIQAEAAAKGQPGPQQNLKLEALAPYAAGEGLVILHANQAHQIKAAVEFAEDLGLQFVISGGHQAWKVRTLLAEKKVDVILSSPFGSAGGKFERYDATFRNAARLHESGVRFCFYTNSASNVRNLPEMAATASAYGLPREEALAAITIRPAQILGFDDITGSLEVGKRADVIVTDGDPLEIVTHTVYMFIHGEPISLESKHTRLFERYRQRLEE